MIEELDKQPDMKDLAMLQKILTNLHQKSAAFHYTDTVPTADTAPNGKIILCDDGAATKRLYFKTGKGRLGYIDLT